MAPTATRTSRPPTPLEAELAAADAALQAHVATRDAAQLESDRIFAASSPYKAHGQPSVSRGDELRALARREDVQHALAIAEADVEDAHREVARLREADRLARAQAIRARMMPKVLALADALAAAAQANRDVEHLDAELAAFGAHEPASWPELNGDTPTATSKLTLWRDAMRQQGLLDDIAG